MGLYGQRLGVFFLKDFFSYNNNSLITILYYYTTIMVGLLLKENYKLKVWRGECLPCSGVEGGVCNPEHVLGPRRTHTLAGNPSSTAGQLINTQYRPWGRVTLPAGYSTHSSR